MRAPPRRSLRVTPQFREWGPSVRFVGLAILVAGALLSSPLFAAPSSAATLPSATTRDGLKDFDFLIGTWSTHYKRLRHALSNNHEWYGCGGSSIVRALWDGNANIEDGDVRCPGDIIRGMTLRTYDAKSHQWSLYWGTEKHGLVTIPQVGHFDANGVGQFFADDTYAGRPIIVRYQWTKLAGDHPHFEQAFSADKGATWETNWICDYTRATKADL